MHELLQRCAVFCALLAVVSLPVRGSDQKLERLLVEIEKIPMVDTHCHVPLPARDLERFKNREFRYDVTWLLGNVTYVAEFIHGKDWPEIKKTLAVNAHHTYYRPIRQALVDLYGLDPNAELNDGNVDDISRRIDARHRDATNWYNEVYNRANVSDVLWMEAQPGVAPSVEGDITQLERPENWLAHTRRYPMWNIDWTILLIAAPLNEKDRKALGFDHRIDQTEKQFGVKLRNLADMEALIDREITKFFQQGGVGLKSTAAYFRPLDFDTTVPRKQAESVFAEVVMRKTPTEARRKRLEDYLMTKVFQTLNKLKKPIQFHTGNQQSWN
ncbi:MAG TPA: hypothetical protein VH744_14000, partial [Terriglobales bacterium]